MGFNIFDFQSSSKYFISQAVYHFWVLYRKEQTGHFIEQLLWVSQNTESHTSSQNQTSEVNNFLGCTLSNNLRVMKINKLGLLFKMKGQE